MWGARNKDENFQNQAALFVSPVVVKASFPFARRDLLWHPPLVVPTAVDSHTINEAETHLTNTEAYYMVTAATRLDDAAS